MASIVILVVSFAAAIEFGVGYCRSLIATCAESEISLRTRALAGLSANVVSSADFNTLVKLTRSNAQLCSRKPSLVMVRIYFRALRTLRPLFDRAPKIARWMLSEQAACTHFLAVCLDRRLTSEE